MRTRRARTRGTLALLTVVCAFGLTAPASAQTALDQAKSLTGRATIEYNVGRFDEALDLYSKAYEALPTPALLFDIGQCHRMIGNHERAIFFYQGYLRAQPDAPNRTLVEGLLDDQQRLLNDQRAAASKASEPPPSAAAPSSLDVPAPAREPEVVVLPVTGRPGLQIAGLTTAGVGVVVIVTAVALGLHAASLSNEIAQVSSERGTWSPSYQADYQSGQGAAKATTALAVLGSLAVATGGVFTYLGWPRRAGIIPGAAIAPVAAPHGGSVVLTGRF